MQISPSSLKSPIEIDGASVAHALELEVDSFRKLMDNGKITLLCERGTGSDEGRLRVTFWHGRLKARFLYDGEWSPA